MVLILNVRQYPCPVITCSFRKPNLIFDAEHYAELIDLRATEASNLEPPYCMAMGKAQLDARLLTPLREGVPNNTHSTHTTLRR